HTTKKLVRQTLRDQTSTNELLEQLIEHCRSEHGCCTVRLPLKLCEERVRLRIFAQKCNFFEVTSHFDSRLTLKLSRAAAGREADGKLFLPCGLRPDAVSA